MLNKLTTYQAGLAAGVPTPRFGLAPTREELLRLKDEFVYPLLVKPLYTHRSGGRLGRRFITAHNFDELLAAHQTADDAEVETLLLEMIPGPDDRLCSYYTYLDEHGNPLLDFTKRVIRRFPTNSGEACYHITDEVPEVRELGLKLFRQVGLRGLANVEFKRDERDGQLKLIECNARFTAANGLVADSGVDLALFVYNRLVGRPQSPPESFVSGMRLWYPIRDFRAFLELRRQGRLTFGRWLASVWHRQTFPFFRWSDPLPAVAKWVCAVKADVPLRGVRNLARRALAALRLTPSRSGGSPQVPAPDRAAAEDKEPAALASGR
jgi:predicted ATP-grasp superfamily ATP-dependent carboligase